MTWKRSTLITLGSSRRRGGGGLPRWVVIGLLLVVAVPGLLAAVGALREGSPPPLRLSRMTVEIEGTRLAFHRVGQGPDLLLIHGGMGTAEDFEPVLAALAQGHRVTVVDRPGFGGSTAPDGSYTISGNARILAELIRVQGLNRPVVVGHSHGAGVALRLALDAPERVGGLVLLAASAFPDEGGAPILDRVLALPRVGEGVAAIAAGLAPGRITSVVTEGLGPDLTKVPPDFISWRAGAWNTPLSVATHSRQRVSNPDEMGVMAPRYATLKIPAVVLWCEQDPWEMHGTIQSARLARELSAREVRLTGCGHYIQYGKPEAVIEAVSRLSPGVRTATGPPPVGTPPRP